MSKILIAMSGGVDSSVAAHLIKSQGHNAVGVMLSLHGAGAAEDAKAVADSLNINFNLLDFQDEFKERVIGSFVDTYLAGETPNPCVVCNRYIKFGALMEQLDHFGCDGMATGHYARVLHENGRFVLKKALDPTKDQSYVLYSLTQEQLAKTLFPLGEMTKKQVREIAAELGFVNSDKADSQDICFVPNGKYTDFIEQHMGRTFPVGKFIDKNGNVLGEHKGTLRYTIGQRRGIGLSFRQPMFVTAINAADNTVCLGEERELFSMRCTATDLNWIAFDNLKNPLKCAAKIRYNSPEQLATIHPVGENEVAIEFEKPERAITPGQAVVFYDGNAVLGGGTICSPNRGR